MTKLKELEEYVAYLKKKYNKDNLYLNDLTNEEIVKFTRLKESIEQEQIAEAVYAAWEE